MRSYKITRREVFVFGLVIFALLLAIWVEGQQTANSGTSTNLVCHTNITPWPDGSRHTNILCHDASTNAAAIVPYRTALPLSWTVANFETNVPVTNHLLWSTNSPGGPWMGDIPILCTGAVMQVQIRINTNLPEMFFRMGTNTF
jgi:hypothetical protein